jgi:hypothetical protein
MGHLRCTTDAIPVSEKELVETKDVIECAVQSHLSTIADGLGVVNMDMLSFDLQSLAENNIYTTAISTRSDELV